MLSIDKDENYVWIVEHILQNNEFKSLDAIEHHGTSRFAHSLRVSYYSYKICKFLHLDYENVARAGLLHDFFFSSDDRTMKDKFLSVFTHPKKSVDNAKRVFEINEKEEDIIKTHMFPLYTAIPKYAESWIVSLVDKTVASYEFAIQFKTKMNYATNLFIIILLNSLR